MTLQRDSEPLVYTFLSNNDCSPRKPQLLGLNQ
jgi:hypothetical protein